jgi:hypothetical protein
MQTLSVSPIMAPTGQTFQYYRTMRVSDAAIPSALVRMASAASA